MSALSDVLHRLTEYLPWRTESDRDNVHSQIEDVESEIRSWVTPAGVKDATDADRVENHEPFEGVDPAATHE